MGSALQSPATQAHRWKRCVTEVHHSGVSLQPTIPQVKATVIAAHPHYLFNLSSNI
jgi:hypothetical protein